LRPRLHLDKVALAIVETDGLDPFVPLQRQCQAGGGILPTGEQDQGACMHRRMVDESGPPHAFLHHLGRPATRQAWGAQMFSVFLILLGE